MRSPRLTTLVLLAALVLPASPAHAAPELTYGVVQPADVLPYKSVGCTAVNKVWAQEFGVSGVNRFRFRWELRSPYDTGWLPTYAKTHYLYSNPFPDDARNSFAYFTLGPGAINFAANKEFGLWVKIVGERPSFWQRDLVLKSEVGRLGCNLGVGTS